MSEPKDDPRGATPPEESQSQRAADGVPGDEDGYAPGTARVQDDNEELTSHSDDVE
jgi:hypothetical protein